MPKRFLIFTGALSFVALLIVFYLVASRGNEQPASASSERDKAQPVSVLTLQPHAIALTALLPGRISAYKQSQVRPQVNGIITRRLFEEGVDVRKGEQLYQIDDARYRAAWVSAKADLNSAQASIQSIQAKTRRYSELVQIEAVSRQEYDDIVAQYNQAKAAIAVAQAAVDVAKVNLDYTKVYAPISGRIGRSLVTAGTLVTANQQQPLTVITQLDPVYVDMQQSGDQAVELRAKMAALKTLAVQILFGDANTRAYPQTGILKFSEVTVDESTGSIILRAVIPNPDKVLLPGLFVRAQLDLGHQHGLLVPQRATMRTPEGNLQVWIVDKHKRAQQQFIQANGAYKDYWIVNSGLKVNDVVIVAGYQNCKPNQPVETTVWQDSSLTVENQSPITQNAKHQTQTTAQPVVVEE